MIVQDDYNEAYEAGEKFGRLDDTERCARLCQMRADISRASAAKIRRDGSYTVRCIWPLFQLRTLIAPRWERAAQDHDAVANAFEVVATCIRKGYDPRTPDPSEKIRAMDHG